MRLILLTLPLLFLASCGGGDQTPRRQSEDLQTFDVQEDAASSSRAPAAPGSPPSIAPTAAPGVAFNYKYAFRLQGQRIGQVQEQHAQMCERLGINRCRITGMHYRVVNESDIEGMLAFKLDPTIARHFGRAGIEAVTRAEGMLIESEISGTDVGTAIRTADRNVAEMNEDLRRIEARLAGRLSDEERTRLTYEAQALRQSIRATRTDRQEQQESLATTPMTFAYGSGDLVPGFDTHSPFRDAVDTAGNNFISAIATLFVLVVSILPWLLVLLLGLWLFRAARRRGWIGAPNASLPEQRPEVSQP